MNVLWRCAIFAAFALPQCGDAKRGNSLLGTWESTKLEEHAHYWVFSSIRLEFAEDGTLTQLSTPNFGQPIENVSHYVTSESLLWYPPIPVEERLDSYLVSHDVLTITVVHWGGNDLMVGHEYHYRRVTESSRLWWPLVLSLVCVGLVGSLALASVVLKRRAAARAKQS